MHTQNRIDLQIIFHISDDIKWIIKRFRSSPPILIRRINKTGKIRMNKKLIIHNLNSKCYHCINHRTVINNLELFKLWVRLLLLFDKCQRIYDQNSTQY
ncbi:hypothetical protein T07_2454 [Trichinella nelsoni]|uniref:Uncharacterized protein n=1 Tax=Trichinella nelsoni TaxID=6336 RepID=A0A0V0S7D5_9BILA|nr:hypothetical protein T07_2454 [Trichinella nelsoni]